ncbi:Germin-like protein subfamily 1 member 11 [Forsythia ovata]|uniref:Germin-like protein n=1 Tax=Forsythia ovata TaxID=205694 RepID=A0ABD1S397_9LAMI
MASRFLFLGLLIATCSISLASDSSPLQDICVAYPHDPGSWMKVLGIRLMEDLISSTPSEDVPVNGLACKDPRLVRANDFFFSGLDLPGDTSNPLGSKVTPVNVVQIPGLNTLGIYLVRIDYAPWGINPPHTHPRATELLTVIEGSIEVGFVTSNPENNLYTKILEEGDVFVFPEGLVHFQRNNGSSNAVAIAALRSQNPGVITIANAVFGSNPAIPDDLLAKSFQVDNKTIDLM